MFKLFRKTNGSHEQEVSKIKGQISGEIKKTVTAIGKANKQMDMRPIKLIVHSIHGVK